MSWASKLRAPLFLGVAAVLSVGACGDDSESNTKDAATAAPVDASSTHADTSTTPVNTGKDAASENTGEQDADTSDSDAGDDDAATDADAGTPTDGDGGAAVVSLPADGKRLAVCYAKSDCMGDDLVCYMPDTSTPGFCTDNCATDSDCQPLGGIATTCSPDSGQCRTDCTGTGMGDGMCPEHMTCRNVAVGVLTAPAYRCTYPAGSGSHSSSSYGRCNSDHGNNDCSGDLACFVPGALVPGNGPVGYCSSACTDAKGCSVPAGASAVAACAAGRCELDCSGSGTTCPTGMSCRDTHENLATETYRCIYIE